MIEARLTRRCGFIARHHYGRPEWSEARNFRAFGSQSKSHSHEWSVVVDVTGPIDPETIVAIIGFDAGGPLNFCTIGKTSDADFVTYISCELAVRDNQQPASFGRYELLISCNDEQWVRSNITPLGHASLENTFDHGHSIDIGPWVEPDDVIQGLIFECASTSLIDGKRFGVLRVIGVTRTELDFALRIGVSKLIVALKSAGIYPHTDTRRETLL